MHAFGSEPKRPPADDTYEYSLLDGKLYAYMTLVMLVVGFANGCHLRLVIEYVLATFNVSLFQYKCTMWIRMGPRDAHYY